MSLMIARCMGRGAGRERRGGRSIVGPMRNAGGRRAGLLRLGAAAIVAVVVAEAAVWALRPREEVHRPGARLRGRVLRPGAGRARRGLPLGPAASVLRDARDRDGPARDARAGAPARRAPPRSTPSGAGRCSGPRRRGPASRSRSGSRRCRRRRSRTSAPSTSGSRPRASAAGCSTRASRRWSRPRSPPPARRC